MNKQIIISYEEYLRLVDDSNYNKERYDILSKDYTENINELQQRINRAIELIENDYFEDGSFENYDEVMNLLRGEDDE